jgi:hypothetical protein
MSKPATIVDLRGNLLTPDDVLRRIVGRLSLPDSRGSQGSGLMWVRVSLALHLDALASAGLCMHYGYDAASGERLDGAS